MPKHSPTRRRSWIVAFVAMTGCVPILSPPVHAKLGYTRGTEPVVLRDGRMTDSSALASIGLDSASVSDLPVHAGVGVQNSHSNSGPYASAGWIRRVRPRVRFGVNSAYEHWWADGGGRGARVGITLEYTDESKAEAYSEVQAGSDGTHDQSTLHVARAGSFAIGGYVDVGHRWLDSQPNDSYVSFGLSFRLAAVAGVVDVTDMH